MKAHWLLAGVAAAAIAGGAGLWWASRPGSPTTSPGVSPGALLAASFRDTQGNARSIGQFEGRVLVVNFWATWCAPCREEMPGFARLQARWGARNVQFLGLAHDDPAKVERFGRELAIPYPLWVGGEEVGELSRRLGNRLGVLPHTVIVDPRGVVVASKVGPYSESELESMIVQVTSKSPKLGDIVRN